MMTLSTDLAKVCARESAIPDAIHELKQIAAKLPGKHPKILIVSVMASEGTFIGNVNFRASCGDDGDIIATSVKSLLSQLEARPTAAQRKRAEAAKLLEEAAKLEGVGK